jgi:hypothetical protein
MQLLISGSVIVDVGPFHTDPETGDVSNERGGFSKAALDAGEPWRVVDIPDENMPADFALGAYQYFTDGVAEELIKLLPAAPDAATLVMVRAEKWEAIKAKRDGRLIDGGFLCNGHWFHSDLVSRSQFLANALRASELRTSGGDMDAVFHNADGDIIAIKTMDNGFVPVTANTALAIMPAFELQESKTYKAALMHKAALDASDDPENYDFSAGWPAIYEGA